MKKIYSISLAVLCLGASIVYAMEEPLAVDQRNLIITNSTDDTLRTLTGIDDQEPIGSIILKGDKVVLPFENTITSLSIGTTAALSYGYGYLGEITSVLEENPDMNIVVNVESPDSSGMFGFVTARVMPYVLDVEAQEGIREAFIIIPSSGKIIDAFPLVAQKLKDAEDAEFLVTDILAVGPGVSRAKAKRVVEFKKDQWKKLMQRARENEEAVGYAKKVIAVLDKAEFILTMKPEILGKIFTEELGLVPKDPEKRKALEEGTGLLMQRVLKARLMQELRALLLGKELPARKKKKT